MWTANLIEVEKSGGSVRFRVRFTHAEEHVDFYFSPAGQVDSDWLKRNVQNKIDELNSLYAFADTQTLGPVAVLVEQALTKEEQALIDFKTELRTLEKMKNAVSLGLMDEADPSFVDQMTLVKEAYQPEYADKI